MEAPQGRSKREGQITPASSFPLPKGPKAVRVSIIGTAGRGESREGLNAALYSKMVTAAEQWIAATVSGEVHLVSGGAAWADHIAVTLFLNKRCSALTVYLPCPLELTGTNYAYRDTGVKDFKVNPGRTANRYHQEFSQEMGKNTLNEVGEAIRCGAKAHVFDGFHARNTEVARSEYVIALTWADGDEPAWGGTLDTWKKSRAIKRHHISLKVLTK